MLIALKVRHASTRTSLCVSRPPARVRQMVSGYAPRTAALRGLARMFRTPVMAPLIRARRGVERTPIAPLARSVRTPAMTPASPRVASVTRLAAGAAPRIATLTSSARIPTPTPRPAMANLTHQRNPANKTPSVALEKSAGSRRPRNASLRAASVTRLVAGAAPMTAVNGAHVSPRKPTPVVPLTPPRKSVTQTLTALRARRASNRTPPCVSHRRARVMRMVSGSAPLTANQFAPAARTDRTPG